MKSSSFGWYRVLYIILAILYIFAGMALVANPAYFAPSMIYMIGWLAVIYGVIMVAAYFMAVNFKSIYTLLFGFAMIVLGIVIMANLFPASVALGAITGIGFLLVGAFKIYQSLVVKDLGISSWWVVLILGLCNIIVGIILICNLSSAASLLTLLIGCNLLVTGVSDLMIGFTGI